MIRTLSVVPVEPTLDQFLAALEAHPTQEVVDEGRGKYLTNCLHPEHDDDHPSLRFEEKQGKLVVFCDACEADGRDHGDIWAAVVALVDGDDSVLAEESGEREPEADLDFAWYAEYLGIERAFLVACEQHGHLAEMEGGGIAFVFKGTPKIACRVAKDGKNRFKWVEEDTPQAGPLWPVPDKVGDHIWLAEGQSDTLVLRYLGVEAYTLGSAATTPPPGTFEALVARGAERLTVVYDFDGKSDAGRDRVVEAALHAGLLVSVVRVPPNPWGPKDVAGIFVEQGDDLLDYLAGHTRVLPPRRTAQIYTLEEALVVAKESVEYVIENLISPGEIWGLVGAPKTYKTFMALDAARAVATGGRFLARAEFRVQAPSTVLVIEEEGGLGKFMQRVEKFFPATDAPVLIRHRTGFNLLNDYVVDELIDQLLVHEVGLLILDPWQRMTAGLDENDSGATAPAWDALHRVTYETQAAVLLIHHANKSGGLTLNAIRGSSRFAGEVDLATLVDHGKVEEDDPPNVVLARFEGRELPGHLDGETHDTLRIGFEDPWNMHALGFEITLKTTREKILAELVRQGPNTPTIRELAKACSVAPATVSQHLQELAAENRVIKGKSGRWEACSA